MTAEFAQAQQLCREIAQRPLHPSLDCTEVAEVFLQEIGTGTLWYIHAGDRPQFFRIREHGHWVKYVYHAVFVLDDWVFDPYAHAEPVVRPEYLDGLQSANPGIALQWDRTLPAGYVH